VTSPAYLFEIAAAGVLCALAIAPAAAATSATALAGPRVGVTAAPVAPGATVTVRLDGWAPGTVTVGVCGNDARRGSQDCALIGDEAVAVRRTAPTVVDLVIVTPPVPCPCVVRADESGTDVARTAPITLTGVPSGPPLAATSDAVIPDQLEVRGTVESPGSWAQSFVRSIGGPSSKTFVLTLHNRGRTAIDNLRVVSEVGRDSANGSPLAVRTVAAVAPGAQVTLRVPVRISAPAFGEYKVSATVYGLATPASFVASTSNDPWALELAAPVALLALAQYIRRRERLRAA